MQSQDKQGKRLRRGFSLGEVLLASFVLTMGLTAATALIVSSVNHSYESRDAVIATELAQEGVELVRNVRDQNFALEKDGTPAGEGFDGFSATDKHCRMDSGDVLFTCQPSQGTPAGRMYYLSTPTYPDLGDRYTHTGTTHRFARYIYIDYDDANKNARVVSYAFWDWPSGGSMPGHVSSTGNTAACTLQNKCVFSEVLLTSWSH